MNEEPVYENIYEQKTKHNCKQMSIDTDKIKTIVFYLKDSFVVSVVLALPVTMIVLPVLMLLVPVLSKYQTEPPPTTTVQPSSRVPQWGLKPCDTLALCPYRLESYLSTEKSVIFCLESKTSAVKSVTLYNRQYCEVLFQFNSTVSQTVAKSLKRFFENEKLASNKTVKSNDPDCPIVLYDNWVTYCFDRKKYLKNVFFASFVKHDSQEAYRLKIYMAAFL